MKEEMKERIKGPHGEKRRQLALEHIQKLKQLY